MIGNAGGPVRLDMFTRIVDVHWKPSAPLFDFEISITAGSQLPAGTGTPPNVIYSIVTEPSGAEQEVLNLSDTTDSGTLTSLRSFNTIIRILAATKVTLLMNSPTAPGLDFDAIGIVSAPGISGSGSIDAQISRDSSGTDAISAAPSSTAEHPTGVLISPGSGSAILVFYSGDPIARE